MGRNIFCFVFDRKLVFFELHDCDFSDSRLGTKLFQNAQTCSFLSTLMETGSHIIFEPCSSWTLDDRWEPCMLKIWRLFSVNLGHPTVPLEWIPTGFLIWTYKYENWTEIFHDHGNTFILKTYPYLANVDQERIMLQKVRNKDTIDNMDFNTNKICMVLSM